MDFNQKNNTNDFWMSFVNDYYTKLIQANVMLSKYYTNITLK